MAGEDNYNKQADKGSQKAAGCLDKLPGGKDPFKEKEKCCCCIPINIGILILGIFQILHSLSMIGYIARSISFASTSLIISTICCIIGGIFIVAAAIPWIMFFKGDSATSRKRLVFAYVLDLLGMLVFYIGYVVLYMDTAFIGTLISCIISYIICLIITSYFMNVLRRFEDSSLKMPGHK